MYSGEKYNMMFKEGYKYRTWFFFSNWRGDYHWHWFNYPFGFANTCYMK